jgi:hypothetical protein
MTESTDRGENITYNEELERKQLGTELSVSETKVRTTGTLRIRSLAEPLLIYGEGVHYIKVPINLEREARRRQNLIVNNWLDDPDTSMIE